MGKNQAMLSGTVKNLLQNERNVQVHTVPSKFSLRLQHSPIEEKNENENCNFSFDEGQKNDKNKENAFDVLKKIRMENIDNVIIGSLNINSLGHKIDALREIIGNNIDILIIIETKLDDSYPDNQFHIEGFQIPFRVDRNKFGGGIMVYVRKDIPSHKLSKHNFKKYVEGIFIEINLRKSKLLLLATYHSTHEKYGMKDRDYLEEIGMALDVYSQYDKYLLAGDFNIEEQETILSDFLFEYNAKNLVKEKTCFKNLDNPSCVDLFITNSFRSFKNTTTISTGLSDFHKMIITVMKTTFPKAKPKIMIYRDQRNFDENHFQNELKIQLRKQNIKNYDTFHNIFMKVLDRHAPCKQKVLRANHKPYMTKALRQAIMRRSTLENKFYKSKLAKDKRNYKKQKNFTARLLKKERQKYFCNLKVKRFTDNKMFWRTINPFLSNSGSTSQTITLVKDQKIISVDQELAETFNDYFKKSVNSLEINENKMLQNDTHGLSDPVDIAMIKFKDHPSVQNIKAMVSSTDIFSFSKVTSGHIQVRLQNLKTNKASTFMGIPSKYLKQATKVILEPLKNIWNIEVIDKLTFPAKLKLADVAPIHKKLERIFVENYRPVSLLPIVSKIFEKIMQNQIKEYVESFLSKYLCGYRKGFNAQYALLSMIERWKQTLDKGGHAGAVLMDLSKAFDTLNHELLVAKLGAYGFDKSALSIIHDYLTNRWQRTKINTSFSSWTELLTGVPQGSILGPLLFNLYINDLFLETTYTHPCNFADDNSLNAFDMKLEDLIHSLEYDSLSVMIWCENNFLKLNPDKCHFLVAANTNEHLWLKVGDAMVWETSKQKLLGLTIDKKLNFIEHVQNICKKASQKVYALSRVARWLPFYKKRILLKAFIESQFSFCPLLWMFCTRKLNRKINHIHERALRLVYDDQDSSFEELLMKDNTICIHHRNIQYVAIEMFKVVNGIAPPIMTDIFGEMRDLSTRSGVSFQRPRINTVYRGENSIRVFGPLVWDTMLPKRFKSCDSLAQFKKCIRTWIPQNCPCRLCKQYMPRLGFTSVCT